MYKAYTLLVTKQYPGHLYTYIKLGKLRNEKGFYAVNSNIYCFYKSLGKFRNIIKVKRVVQNQNN